MLIRSIVAASTAATAPCHGAFPNALGEHLPAIGFDLLAVVQAANGGVRRQDDGRRNHGAEQRAASHFIGARDELESRAPAVPVRGSLTLPLALPCGAGFCAGWEFQIVRGGAAMLAPQPG